MLRQFKQRLHRRREEANSWIASAEVQQTTTQATVPEHEQSPLGLKELVGQPAHKADAVDIVAVHGLNGHWEKTWIDKNTRTNWLSDAPCLPKDLPCARVLSFGYNSTTYFSRSDSNISDFASELLAAMSACRRSDEERRRPIIFLCHSLGGLVFKQSVIRAHEQTNFYSSLLESIKAVIFFATPHRGSEIASWEHIGTTLVRAATVGFSTNKNLARDLKVDSELARRISDSFACRGWPFIIKSFYETELMPGLNYRVVEKESAVLKWGNEVDIASPSNHGNICKFPSATDHRYKTVVASLQDILADVQSQIREPPLTAQETAFMETLNSNYQRQLGQVDEEVPGTCEWVLAHPQFKMSQSVEASSLLWITSSAGCGKSVLAKYLVSHFESRGTKSKKRRLAYFFFLDGIEEQDNARSAVAAILHQLCQLDRAVLRHTMQQQEGFPTNSLKDIGNLWSVLINSLEASNIDELIWIMDGLDECDSKSLRQLMNLLSRVLDPSGHSDIFEKCTIRFILLSRPSSLIQQSLGLFMDQASEKRTYFNKFRLEGENESKAIMQDILRFAHWKTAELAKMAALPAEVLQVMEDRLVSGADFTFLWISLVLKIIEDATLDGISVTQVMEIFDTTSLDSIYLHLLQSVCKSDRWKTRKLLSLILAAVRPLTLEEMCVAVEVQEEGHLRAAALQRNTSNPTFELPEIVGQTGIPKGWHEEVRARSSDGTKALKELGERLRRPFDNHVRQLCGHFVRIRDGRLYLVHQTAKDFLTYTTLTINRLPRPGQATLNHQGSEDLTNQWLPITRTSTEKVALDVTVNYIKIITAATIAFENGASDEAVKSAPKSFMLYAGLHWVDHYRPLRRELDGAHDGLLQPRTALFKTWITQWLDSARSAKDRDCSWSRRDSVDSQLSEHLEVSEWGVGQSGVRAHWLHLWERFDNLHEWVQEAYDVQVKVPDDVETKMSIIACLLGEADDKMEVRSFTEHMNLEVETGVYIKKGLDDLFRQIGEVRPEAFGSRAKALVTRLLSDVETSQTRILADNGRWEKATQERLAKRKSRERLRDPLEQMWVEAKKEELLLDMLLHFGLFRPEEAGVDHDEFLESNFGEEYLTTPVSEVPAWVSRYIRKQAVADLSNDKVLGTPGASLPGLSNPLAGSGGSYLHSRFRARGTSRRDGIR